MAINRVEAEALNEVAKACAQEGSALAALMEDLSSISAELKNFANGDNGLEMPLDMADETLAYAKKVDEVLEQYVAAGRRGVVSVNNMNAQIQEMQAAAAAGAAASSEATQKQTSKMDDVQGGVKAH